MTPVIEEVHPALIHYQRFIDTGSVGVAGGDVVGAVQLKQDVFVVVSEGCILSSFPSLKPGTAFRKGLSAPAQEK